METLRCGFVHDVRRWAGELAQDYWYSRVLTQGDVCVEKPDGSPLLCVLRQRLQGAAYRQVYRAVAPLARSAPRHNRGLAAGKIQEVEDAALFKGGVAKGSQIGVKSGVRYRPMKKDGTLSRTVYAKDTPSFVMGFADRSARFPYCRQTAYTAQHPATTPQVLPALQQRRETALQKTRTSRAVTPINNVFGPPEDVGNAGSQTGTSVFDPVLCEIAYRWFCPPGGQVLDPFAGGSVRGIVAATLGRAYTGIDLRPEQIAANQAQWHALSLAAPLLPLPVVPRVEIREGLLVVRDDETPGGTKHRALLRVLPQYPAEELVYASPAYGFAQIALALACRELGKQATIFTAKRTALHPCTRAAQAAGATIRQVPYGYLSHVQAAAKAYCTTAGACLLPFGLESEPMLEAVAAIAHQTAAPPAEVWCVAGSGLLARALRRAWPEAHLCVVVIGKAPALPTGRVTVYHAPEAFEDPARSLPPFPSCSHYDAKAWQFLRQYASPGALFWNVAGNPPALAATRAAVAPTWLVGDSTALETLPLAPPYDFLFTCPPYANLERYSDDPRDLSTMPYAAFLRAYSTIIQASVARLREDRFACIVVSDVRDGHGFYRNLVSETIRCFHEHGMALYNEAILVTMIGSLPLRVGQQFAHARKLGKTHQNVLVFVRGDPRRATAACGAVDVELSGGEEETDRTAEEVLWLEAPN